ncbi:MAG: hypothetical protein M1821_007838 [Bathelium mastoideum]|nr:MAG: hypothetical protein M1821_007838 [Bathelium mastoideum]KAI9683448.1 MAG: hypothetical protein M1822_005988 [Bathelium mastoideum]
MPGLLDLPETVRRQIFAYVLPDNLAVNLAAPFRVSHSLFHIPGPVRNDALAAFAAQNKFHIWVWGSEINNDDPQLSLPHRSFLPHITRLHLTVRAGTLEAIHQKLGVRRLTVDGARLATYMTKFERLKLLVIGIPKVAPPEHINEALLLRFLNHIKTSALVVVDGELSTASMVQLHTTMSNPEVSSRILKALLS